MRSADSSVVVMPTTLVRKTPSAWLNFAMPSWANSGSRDLHLDLREAITPGARGARELLLTALRDAVRSGRLAAGTMLPPSRSLATDLGLARNTVAEAYAELVAEGWLASRQGAGTWVVNTSGAQMPARPRGCASSRPTTCYPVAPTWRSSRAANGRPPPGAHSSTRRPRRCAWATPVADPNSATRSPSTWHGRAVSARRPTRSSSAPACDTLSS